MLKVLQVRIQEHSSCRKENSISEEFDRSKFVDMKFLQNSISTQTLLKRVKFQVKHF